MEENLKEQTKTTIAEKLPLLLTSIFLKQEIAIQPALVSLRNAIHDAIPEAVETIAWSMPTWKKKGYIIHFSVSKNHIGVHVGEEAVTHLPLSLISDIAKWCFTMDQIG